jgi:hypothetical protein
MANPTSNFGWQMPTPTDLVTDLPADFEVFGQAVDTSLADLKGGTTGQVLAKNSNTNMDFVWVTSDDANAIQNTIVDAKGDLIAASASDVPARLAVGNNGETLVADSSTSTGLRYGANFAAGKNKIINGDFTINQRAFSSTAVGAVYTFDRWKVFLSLSTGSATYSAQTFTAGAAPVAGYEARNFLRCITSGVTSANSASYTFLTQYIEDVRSFANQTVTVSFWAKAASGTPKVAVELGQFFGSGGSPSATVNTYGGQATLSTSWARYSVTVAVPSISGKTIGTDANSSALLTSFWLSAGADFNSRTGSLGQQDNTFDIWGVQVEAGSVATAFQTATGTIQGELAACQRYYWRFGGDSNYQQFYQGTFSSTTNARVQIYNPVPMRTKIASIEYANIYITDGGNNFAPSAASIDQAGIMTSAINFTVTSATQYRVAQMYANNTTAAYIAASAEL